VLVILATLCVIACSIRLGRYSLDILKDSVLTLETNGGSDPNAAPGARGTGGDLLRGEGPGILGPGQILPSPD